MAYATQQDYGTLIDALGKRESKEEDFELEPDALTDSADDILGRATESVLEKRRAAIAAVSGKKRPAKPAGNSGRLEKKFFKDLRFFKYYEAQGYVNPAEFLMQVIATNTKTLAEQLRCDLAEVFKMKMQAANWLLPYRLAKLPQTAEASAGNDAIFLALHGTAEQGGFNKKETAKVGQVVAEPLVN